MKDPFAKADLSNQILVSVFAAPGLAGARASVRLMQHQPELNKVEQASGVDRNEACCCCWPEGDGVGAACYNNGVAIEFCGHGLLACAAAWRQRYSLPGRLITVTANTRVQTYEVSEDSDGTLWLQAPRIACTASALPREPWFACAPGAGIAGPASPESAAIAGPDNGYWILRWPDGFDLTTLQPNFSAICRSTSRALIATCRARPGSPHDVGLRYFAPQYGKNEDSVTGSAAVVLADYWQQPELALRQFSLRGGLVRARLGRDSVAISGATTILPEPEPGSVQAIGADPANHCNR